MAESFLIVHPDGRRYRLRDEQVFADVYEPQGFVVAGKTRADANKRLAELRTPDKDATVKDLREQAKALGITGYSSMNKETLISEIQRAEPAVADDDEGEE